MIKKLNFRLHIEKKRGGIVIFSLPQSNHYHQVTNLEIGKNEIREETVWKNRVLLIKNSDTDITFHIELKEINTNFSERLTLENYIQLPNPLPTPDRFINGQDQKIISFARKTVEQENNLSLVVRRLYDFTLDFLSYGRPTDGLYTYRQAMEERITDCGGFLTFLASLLQSIGIPSRLVVGFLIKEDFFTHLLSRFDICTLSFDLLSMHAWLEILLPDSTWFPLDPSIEWRRTKGLTKRKGGFGYIPADRLATSFGQNFEIQIEAKKYKIDLLQKPIYLNR